MSGQTLTDRIAAAQYQLTGSDMARAVCKATTHEVMAPKKKHLECKCCPFFLLCTWGGHHCIGSTSQPSHNRSFCNILGDAGATRVDLVTPLVTPLVTLESACQKNDSYRAG